MAEIGQTKHLFYLAAFLRNGDSNSLPQRIGASKAGYKIYLPVNYIINNFNTFYLLK
jgi:hypothetical protein